MKQRWLLSVRSHTAKRQFIFIQKDDETEMELYKRAKREKTKLEEKFKGQPVVVELISHGKAFKPPKDWRPPYKIATGRDRNWCPYCIKFRLMILDDKLGVHRCPVCGITEQDFYFKSYNGLFSMEWEQYLRERENKK